MLSISIEMLFITKIILSPSFFRLVKNPRNVRFLTSFARVLALQTFGSHILLKRLIIQTQII
ncbi:hypothetical protein BL107_05799 [Synechococcus sp. BL107]|nr:hypothetical protein BL107_05799 [Synechococcus sp. BL107]